MSDDFLRDQGLGPEDRPCNVWEGLDPPYSTIVADPPWPFKWSGGRGGRRAKDVPLRYTLMGLTEIAALPVDDLGDQDANLFLWATPEMHRRGKAVEVAEAWGFRVITEIIWEKPNLGMGHFPRNCHEPLLVCTRGQGTFAGPYDVRSVQRWAQPYTGGSGKTHSAKPAAAYDLIEQVSPGPYVELFARAPRLGWDSWGKGYESSVA
jgi:N6-adenosine-specific RNA methylase IME4